MPYNYILITLFQLYHISCFNYLLVILLRWQKWFITRKSTCRDLTSVNISKYTSCNHVSKLNKKHTFFITMQQTTNRKSFYPLYLQLSSSHVIARVAGLQLSGIKSVWWNNRYRLQCTKSTEHLLQKKAAEKTISGTQFTVTKTSK